MGLPSKYHNELRYQLDMADAKLLSLLGRGWCNTLDDDLDIAFRWRHMLIVELNRVQNEEWDHG